MSRWFRHYAGMARDDKLVSVAIRSKQTVERVVWVWGAILESAAEIDENGRFELDAAEVAYFLRADQADIERVVVALEELGRLHAGFVAKWGDRQFQSDRSAERQKRYRDKHSAQRDVHHNAGDVVTVTSPSRDGDSPETETEAEEEVTTPNASAARPNLSDLMSRLCSAAGKAIANPAGAAGLLALSDPINWVQSGCDLDLDVIPAITARSAGRPPGEIRSWSYFTKAVFQARDTRLKPSPEPIDDQPRNRQGQPASRARSGADAYLAAIREEAEQLDDRGFPDRRDHGADFGDGRTLDLRANEAA
ncbi:hypothetical protein [Kaistia terrae]|uniref:DUF1376 domain-containing protein n=1 Tax=Kaistia terrae TaxID=537017 RepID=A0ABW0Q4Y3_9HYPH|nr:hypothetical protein [Kaistia terrae]MCX5581469.1 hypothetical protein [Kaistia terrae]